MSTLLHISDTHFGTERAEVVAALLALANELAPERVVLSGDMTQRARRSQFAAARRFVDALPAPTLAIPGNHDIPLFNLWGRLRHPYANFRRDFGRDLAPCWSSSQWHVLALNTTRWWRHKDGEVSSRQRADIARQLRAASPDAVRIVVTHQPMRVTRERDEANLLHGHALAAEAWAPAGVDLLLGGHIHLPYVVPLLSTSMAAPYVVQAGTAVSRRVRGEVPNSVNVLRRDGLERRCVVERWDFDRHAARFERVDTRVLALRDHAATPAHP
jgi:3',5'-cyclic AMP phosphodiesterase CpdA